MDKTQVWGQMVVEHPSGINASVYITKHQGVYSSIYCLLLIIFLLLAFKYIRHSIIPIIRCCFRFSLTIKTDDDLSIEQGRFILFFFSIFHFSVITFYLTQIYKPALFTAYGLILIPVFGAFALLFYLLKSGILLFIGWLIRQPNELRFLAKSPRDFAILATVLTLPLSLFNLFAWLPSEKPLIYWCFGVLAFCYLLFLLRTLRYFIHAHFSVFFWILYLCSLEIAPLALIYSALLTI